MEEVKSDRSLSSVRTLVDNNRMGYSWENGLIFLTSDDSRRKMLVVPQSKREQLIEIAHDKLGHVGSRKTRELLNS